MTIQKLPTKDPEELIPITFDFTSAIEAGATASPQAVSVEVFSGNDPAPGGLLYGAPVPDGAKIVQWVTGGISGVTYKLRCRAQISDGQILVIATKLPVKTF